MFAEQWVWKKQGHDYKYLPRRNDSFKEYDYKEAKAGPEYFPEKLEGEAPKLWLAWIYRAPNENAKRTIKNLKKLFGEKYQVGRMEVFKNAASVNEALWQVKHMIELKPLTFPNGEPAIEDVNALEILHDGRCIIDKNIKCDESQLTVTDSLKQWTPRQISGRLNTRYRYFKDVFEDTVYNPSNISIID